MRAYAPIRAPSRSATRRSPVFSIQRKLAASGSGDCAEGPERKLQRHATERASTAAVPRCVGDVLGSPGAPLDHATRSFGTAAFGHDFGKVRVHADARAADSARSIDATAYTVGEHIVFGHGQYAPVTEPGRRLLAHELAHVVQQAGGARSLQSRAPGGMSAPDDASEREADRAADAALRGGVARCHGRSGREARLLQRQTTTTAPATPTSERVWGFLVTRSMCRCQSDVQADIEFKNRMITAYQTCDVATNPDGDAVDACVDLLEPNTVTGAVTSPSGEITIEPQSTTPGGAATTTTGDLPASGTPTDPCERIVYRRRFVHEEFHRRHDNELARAQGTAFYTRWRELAGDPARMTTLETEFPTETAAFRAQRNSGHDWAQDEVRSYRWERRFLEAVQAALRRICP